MHTLNSMQVPRQPWVDTARLAHAVAACAQWLGTGARGGIRALLCYRATEAARTRRTHRSTAACRTAGIGAAAAAAVGAPASPFKSTTTARRQKRK